MHRQMILTSTYQQDSQISERSEQLDADNRLYSRMPMRRLDAEELRDAILVAADALNDTGGGPSEPVQVHPSGLVLTGQRRSIYVQQLRKHPPSLLDSFDLPAMNPNCLQRTDSLVPTQALHLWNDTVIRQLASRFADRLNATTSVEQQIEKVYWIALGRPPEEDELAACVDTVGQLSQRWLKHSTITAEASRQKGLATFCHTILNSADFLYID